jgi:Tol biopolymer transport system component
LKLVSPPNSGYYFRFAADGRLVFYSKAHNGSQVGSWAMTPGNPAWTFLTPGFGNFTSDLALAALTDKAAGTTTIIELASGKTMAILQNRASPTIFSPDQKMVAYLLRSLQQSGPEEPQRFDLWVANQDGSQPRSIWSGLEAANLAWFPGGRRLLWTGRDTANRRFGLWVKDFAISDNTPAYTIIESKGLTEAALSEDGQSVAYWVMLQGSRFSGVWLAHSDGSQAKKLDWVGGFRWDSTGELLYVPVRQGNETASALWSFNPATGQSIRLTDPAQTPLKIALDQWQIAPDAKSIIFRNATDNALWQLTFRA